MLGRVSGHAHSGHAHALDARRAGNRRRMWIALAINVVLLIGGIVGAALTGSLALLADAAHVLSDVGAIALGLGAAALASRSGKARRTFGYQRSEVLAALVNGLALVVISALIVVEAISRFGDQVEIDGAGVLIVGALGLLGNAIATWILARGERDDLNLEAVLRHSFADALGSVGVVLAGAILLTTGWDPIDPLTSILIAALILASSWRLIVEPLDVLMEAAPAGLDVERLGRDICAVDGVVEVHELHVWTLTAGFDALAAHLLAAPGSASDVVRMAVEAMLRERYGIEHSTLQMEQPATEGLIEL